MDNKSKKQRLLNFLNENKFDLIVYFIILISLIVILNVFSVLLINGDSMYPTYNDKDIMILKKENEIEREDIVIFTSPESWRGNEKSFIKRIIGVEGDNIVIDNDELIINEEESINIKSKNCGLNHKEFSLNDNEYFVMGDNHSGSNDSLTQLCDKNEDYLIDKDSIKFNGKEFFVIGLGGLFR